MAERLNLSEIPDPARLGAQLKDAFGRNEVIGLPALGGSLLMMKLGAWRRPAPVLEERPEALRVLMLADRGWLDPWIDPSGLDPAAIRFARRVWPGPLALQFAEGFKERADQLEPEFRKALAADGALTFLVPDAQVLVDLVGLVNEPLYGVVFDAEAGPDAEASWRSEMERLEAAGAVDLILDPGAGGHVAQTFGSRPTVVRVGRDGWSIVRPGRFDATQLQRLGAVVILFVCTGNTCRSPMAEAICKAELAARLGCSVEELSHRGYVVLSAGISAYDGGPATPEAVEALEARGISLHEHMSQHLDHEMLDHADVIVGMTRGHRDAIRRSAPEREPTVRLLDPEGRDIDDPIGAELRVYERTADQMQEHVRTLLDSMGVRAR